LIFGANSVRLQHRRFVNDGNFYLSGRDKRAHGRSRI